MLESTGEQNWAMALESQEEFDQDPGRPTSLFAGGRGSPRMQGLQC